MLKTDNNHLSLFLTPFTHFTSYRSDVVISITPTTIPNEIDDIGAGIEIGLDIEYILRTMDVDIDNSSKKIQLRNFKKRMTDLDTSTSKVFHQTL